VLATNLVSQVEDPCDRHQLPGDELPVDILVLLLHLENIMAHVLAEWGQLRQQLLKAIFGTLISQVLGQHAPVHGGLWGELLIGHQLVSVQILELLHQLLGRGLVEEHVEGASRSRGP